MMRTTNGITKKCSLTRNPILNGVEPPYNVTRPNEKSYSQLLCFRVERNRYAVDAATNGPSEGEHEATVHSDRLRAIALASVRCATLAQSTNPPRAAVFFQTQEHRPKSLGDPRHGHL